MDRWGSQFCRKERRTSQLLYFPFRCSLFSLVFPLFFLFLPCLSWALEAPDNAQCLAKVRVGCNRSRNSLATPPLKGGRVEGSDFSGAAEGQGAWGRCPESGLASATPLIIPPVHIFRAFC